MLKNWSIRQDSNLRLLGFNQALSQLSYRWMENKMYQIELRVLFAMFNLVRKYSYSREETMMSEAMAANVLAGLMFFGFVYYIAYIPFRDKKAGLEVPHLFERIKRDVLSLLKR